MTDDIAQAIETVPPGIWWTCPDCGESMAGSHLGGPRYYHDCKGGTQRTSDAKPTMPGDRLRELEHENERLRKCLSRIIRDAKRAKKSQSITRADAIEHIMRLARYAEEAL